MQKDRILIAGAGYLGATLGVRLSADRHLVFALRRNVRDLPKSVTPFEADLVVPNTLRHVPDVDYVFYLAAPPGGTAGEEAHRAAHVDGLRYLLAALVARRIRVRRLFVASCVHVYGGADGRWVDEDSASEGTDARASALCEGEKLAADAPFPTTVVRFGEIYGPGRLGALGTVLSGASLGTSEVGFANLVHRDDALGVLQHLLGLRQPDPLYVAVDREPVLRPALAGWLATQLGRPEPAVDASSGTSLPATNVRCMSERLLESGYRFVFPSYREGYRALLAPLR